MTWQLPGAVAELKRWRAEGLELPIWWRDDDAIVPTEALDRLLALAEKFEAPLHLAVIPELATPRLAERLSTVSTAFVLTHGWRHQNHAPSDKKKAEFGSHRPAAIMLDEIAAGRRRLDELFGKRALPVFTPPWNRIAPEVVDGLSAGGFVAISSFTPRSTRFAASNLLQVNTHLDPVAWKSSGGLLDPSLLDAQLTGHLEARRTAIADNKEPYGLLTHHLVQDGATWEFTATIVKTLLASEVARWTSPLYEVLDS